MAIFSEPKEMNSLKLLAEEQFHPSSESLRKSKQDFRDQLLRDLNPHQLRAVVYDTAQEGPIMVLAGAGAGKTSVLVKRLSHLFMEGLQLDKTLTLTFTRDAAEELRRRVKSSLAKWKDGIVEPAVHTFHSFALKFLSIDAPKGPVWCIAGFSRRPRIVTEDQLSAFRKDLKIKLANGPSHEMHQTNESLMALAEKKWKHENALLELDELVPLLTHILTEHSGLRLWAQELFDEILVDEYQDTSPDQLKLLQMLVKRSPRLFLVGDDDQAIYAFRGADPQCITKTFELFPAMKTIKLEINYRSTPAILSFANRIFKKKSRLFRKTLTPGAKSNSALFTRNEAVQIQACSSDIQELHFLKYRLDVFLASTYLATGDIVFLLRTHFLCEYYRLGLGKLMDAALVDKIQFRTIHSAKGLEFPVVFLPGLEVGNLPYSSEHQSDSITQANMEEERRLFYVAITRAKFCLNLSHANKRVIGGKLRRRKASPFLPSTFSNSLKQVLQKLGN